MRRIEINPQLGTSEWKIPLIRPLNLISEKDLFTLTSSTIKTAVVELERAVEAETTTRTHNNERLKIQYWDGYQAVIAGFNTQGLQVGYGMVELYFLADDLKNKFLSYWTSYLVATEYRNQGLGKGMKVMLENFVAANNTGIGARFLSKLEADSTYKIPAMKLLRQLGARRSRMFREEVHERMLLKRSLKKDKEYPPQLQFLETDTPPTLENY